MSKRIDANQKNFIWNKKAIDKSIIDLIKDLETSTKDIKYMSETLISFRHKSFMDRIKVIRNEKRKMETYYRMMYARLKKQHKQKRGKI